MLIIFIIDVQCTSRWTMMKFLKEKETIKQPKVFNEFEDVGEDTYLPTVITAMYATKSIGNSWGVNNYMLLSRLGWSPLSYMYWEWCKMKDDFLSSFSILLCFFFSSLILYLSETHSWKFVEDPKINRRKGHSTKSTNQELSKHNRCNFLAGRLIDVHERWWIYVERKRIFADANFLFGNSLVLL